MSFQREVPPSHGRGRRFNPYNAHQNSLSKSELSAGADQAPDTQAYGTQPEHDAPIRVKPVYGVRGLFRDWWRGYSDADMASVIGKTYGPHRPGGLIWMTAGETRALIAWDAGRARA